MSKEAKKAKRLEEMKANLPAKFNEMSDEDIMREASLLEGEIATESASIAPKQEELRQLKKYMAEKKLDCQHDELTRLNDKFFECKQCKKRIRVRIG